MPDESYKVTDKRPALVTNSRVEVQQRPETMLIPSKMPVLEGWEDDVTKLVVQVRQMLHRAKMPSLVPLLPLMLSLKGHPYTIRNHFPFEPLFRTRFPLRRLLKTGRQCGKSLALAAFIILLAMSVPHLSILVLTPLFEMIRRFSQNYVRPFIESSPIRRLFANTKAVGSVLQRSFKNGSNLLFSYAFLDAERVRGISSDLVVVDEGQNFSSVLLPIVYETLSGSPWDVKLMAGTPKSTDNTIEQEWLDSSQAEWITKCPHCPKWNIPSLQHDLMKMIGPWREDISEEYPGVVCAACQKPINPRWGRWVHGFPERRWQYGALHIPQIILPMHYANAQKWDELRGKLAGRGNTTMPIFLNECCGESCDAGSKLVTVTDLKRVAVLAPRGNREAAAKKFRDNAYVRRILAVDWGGGGGNISGSTTKEDKKTRTSYTTLAILGMRPNGKIEVPWGYRSLRTHDHAWEAELCLSVYKDFACTHIANDYGGAGSVRETVICHYGFPLDNLLAVVYCGPAEGPIVQFKEPTDDHPRAWYRMDKSASLSLTCQAIKKDYINFFQYDRVSAEDPGLLADFTALIEEKIDSARGTDIYVIDRHPRMSDDFAQAVNIGSNMLWHMTGQYPDLSHDPKFKMTAQEWSRLHPETPEWGDQSSPGDEP